MSRTLRELAEFGTDASDSKEALKRVRSEFDALARLGDLAFKGQDVAKAVKEHMEKGETITPPLLAVDDKSGFNAGFLGVFGSSSIEELAMPPNGYSVETTHVTTKHELFDHESHLKNILPAIRVNFIPVSW